MPLPDPQSDKLAEGTYRFKISREPEQRKTSGGKICVRFYLQAYGHNGESQGHVETLFPWPDPDDGSFAYRDLATALGAPVDENDVPRMSQLDESEMVGMRFKADIVHKPDRDNPQKSWARMTNIRALEDDATPKGGGMPDLPKDDDVPF